MFSAGGPSVPGGGGIPFSTGLPVVQYFPPPRPPFSYATLGNPFYVDSAGGNVYPYDTWAHAATTLATIAAIDQPGNVAYCASTGSETTASAVSWNWAGTTTSSTRIISADKTTGEPPTTVAAGYTVNVTGANNLTRSAGASNVVYFYGLTFIVGAGTSSFVSNVGGTNVCESCSFQIASTSTTAQVSPNGETWINCTVKFADPGQRILGQTTTQFLWTGGSLLAGGSSPTNLFSSVVGTIQNIDLTNASSSVNLLLSAVANLQATFRNILLPSSWSGQINSTTTGWGSVFTLNNCDSSGTNYILHRQTQFGDVYSETTVVRTGGASDGTTPLSWKMVSLAASGTFPVTALQTGEFVIWNDTTGSGKTITVEIVYDSATVLNNNQVWLEVTYYAASGNPQGTLVSSAPATVLTTATAIPASSATWTTTGMSNPQKGYLRVGPITPQLKGYFLATVKLCNASTTVYVDPLMTVA